MAILRRLCRRLLLWFPWLTGVLEFLKVKWAEISSSWSTTSRRVRRLLLPRLPWLRRGGVVLTASMVMLAAWWVLNPQRDRLEPGIALLGLFGSIINTLAAWANPTLSGLGRDDVFRRIADSDPEADWEPGAGRGNDLFYFRWDSNLRVERVRQLRQSFTEGWTRQFPDAANSHADEYHISLGTTPIASFLMVTVDGGRYTLPLPLMDDDRRVTRLQYVLARIFEPPDQSGERQEWQTLDAQMKRLGFAIVEQAKLRVSD